MTSHRTKHARIDREAPIKAELVDQLYASTFNVVFIGFAAAFFCGLVAFTSGDAVFAAFAVLALLIASLRFAIDRAYRRWRERRSVRVWERSHAAGSLLFSLLVAAIGGYTFLGGPTEAQLFSTVFLVSYCTGVLSRLAVRPRLAIACTQIAALPYIVVLLFHPVLLHKLLGLFLLMMSLASIQLIQTTYRLTFEALITRAELAALAGSDALTGLANRFTVDRELQRLFMAQEVRPGQAVAVHFIDLDHFKAANDTFGHDAGDSILVEVGRRLRALLPPQALAARRGGDEFLVVQPRLSSSDEAERLARQIATGLQMPYLLQGQEVAIGASLGVAVTDDPTDTPQRLVAAADQALYEAKRKGRGSVEFSEVHVIQIA
ncbi:GGDEF domain-containing protein [Rhizobium straminoryzae]|uniref:GGDEF domain-containing protein n=1 Tax=Rhizobium straminoryzae TaxID=1387186 RepID=A0A549TG18_9HYPH|nr:GGDEF domain-containing protein [Rhizobium straminoryzae]TRL41527.1 GGDEF domain-containing protein [Rhizobium straminoryzae]